MRFRNAAGLVDLPIYAVEHRFRHEPVLTVLPVRGAIAARDAILVALPDEVAVIIADPERRDGWLTYMAPWEVVDVGAIDSEHATHNVVIHIDRMVLHVELWGPKGERAIRDFAVVAGATPEVAAAAN